MRTQANTKPVDLHEAWERSVAGSCENCERKTLYLVPGFKFQNVPAKVVREMSNETLMRMKAFSAPFCTQGAEVCLRCRPLSNLELEELSGH